MRIKSINKNKVFDVMYSGQGHNWLLSWNHKIINFFSTKEQNVHILDFGGGYNPHFAYISDKSNIKSYTIIDSKKSFRHAKKCFKKYKFKNFRLIDYNKINILDLRNKFTKVVSSHTFEHIFNVEPIICETYAALKKGGFYYIALPCDPGISYRLLQYISFYYTKKKMKWTFEEKDLHQSREHVTTPQRIMQIINFYFNKKKIKKTFFPFFFLPSLNLNFFLILRYKK